MARPARDVPWLSTRGGTYYARWYDGDARTTRGLSLRTRDAAEAKARFAAFLSEGGELTGQKPKTPLTVSEALDHYVLEHANVKAVAANRQEGASRNLQAFFGDTPIAEVDIDLCREYLDARLTGDVTLSGRPAKPATVRRELGVLSAAANHCIKRKRLERADRPMIELPETDGPSGLYLTKDEFKTLQNAADGLVRHYIDLLYYTASRRGAIEKLTWDRVDLVNRRIRLAESGERRTCKRRPVVPIDPILLPTLKALQGADPVRVLPPFDGYARFSSVAKKAGLLHLKPLSMRPAGRASPHILRHSRATHLLQDGKTPWAVANLLGDSLTTLVKTYGHHDADFAESLFGTDASFLE